MGREARHRSRLLAQALAAPSPKRPWAARESAPAPAEPPAVKPAAPIAVAVRCSEDGLWSVGYACPASALPDGKPEESWRELARVRSGLLEPGQGGTEEAWRALTLRLCAVLGRRYLEDQGRGAAAKNVRAVQVGPARPPKKPKARA